jgi:carbonic anhydrase
MSNRQATPTATTAGSDVGRASGFELTDPGKSKADTINAEGIGTALARNRAFAAAGGHRGAIVFPNLRLFVITCLDPRVDPAHFLGLGLSDAIVVRNVGGRVTPEAINDVAFISQITETVIPDGPLFEVAVIHHNQCGSAALAGDEFRRSYAQRIGVEESTLHDHAVLDPVETVRRDVELLRAATAISPRVAVSGHVYDVLTGVVETVLPAAHPEDRSAA